MAHMSNDRALVRVDLNTNVYSHYNILIKKHGRWLCGHLQMNSLKGTCDLMLTMKSLYTNSRYILSYGCYEDIYFQLCMFCLQTLLELKWI